MVILSTAAHCCQHDNLKQLFHITTKYFHLIMTCFSLYYYMFLYKELFVLFKLNTFVCSTIKTKMSLRHKYIL